MPWIDFRFEMRRPLSIVLFGLAVLGWIVVARLAWLHFESEHDYRRQGRLLTIAEATSRAELEQLRRNGGTLAELEGKIAAAQRNLQQLEQSRTEAQTRVSEIEASSRRQAAK